MRPTRSGSRAIGPSTPSSSTSHAARADYSTANSAPTLRRRRPFLPPACRTSCQGSAERSTRTPSVSAACCLCLPSRTSSACASMTILPWTPSEALHLACFSTATGWPHDSRAAREVPSNNECVRPRDALPELRHLLRVTLCDTELLRENPPDLPVDIRELRRWTMSSLAGRERRIESRTLPDRVDEIGLA